MGDPLRTRAPAGAGSRSKAAASASPLNPGSPGGTATTQRQLLGDLEARQERGDCPLPRTAPALHDEAAAGECSRCRSPSAGPGPPPGPAPAGSVGSPYSSASARATARPSWVPEPSPLCGGMARCTVRRAPPLRPWWARNRSANAAARSASGPRGGHLGRGRGLQQQRGRRDRGAEAAEPAAQAAPEIEHPEVQPRGGLDEDAIAGRTYSVSIAIASCSRGPAVLSTITWSRANSPRISSAGNEVGPGRQDGGLEHRVARPVEPDELPADAPVHHPGLDPRAGRRVVDGHDLELAPGAGGLQHRAAHHRRREARGTAGSRWRPGRRAWRRRSG